MPSISKKGNKIPPSPIRKLVPYADDAKKRGIEILHLNIGQPDIKSPVESLNAVKETDLDLLKYEYSQGSLEFRNNVCNYYKKHSIYVSPDDIITTVGASEALSFTMNSICDPGDEVIIPAPYWVSYPDIVLLAGGKPKIIKCDEKNNFKLTPEKLKKAVSKKTKWIIINSPSNPTGSGYTKDEIIALSKILIKYKNLYILSDDIYEHITYDGFKFFTIAQIEKLKSRTLTMNGVSKSYSMTGWRIGYAAGPKEIIKAMAKIQSQSTSNPTSISQAAAVEALNGTQDFISERSNSFKERRNFVVDSLNNIKGISCLSPEGAFYVFPNCKKLLNKKTKLKTDKDFVEKLLEKAEVAVVQGSAFGLDGYFRISYATSMENLKKAMQRIKTFCDSLN